MNKQRFRTGSMAVLFTVVLLCVSILAALTVVTAVADKKTAQRYGAQVEQVYSCENAGQRWLLQVQRYLSGQGTLPEDTWQDGELLGTEITRDRGCLRICLKLTPGGYEILRWSYGVRWQADESWNLWK